MLMNNIILAISKRDTLRPWSPSSLPLLIVAKLLCSCLSLFDAIVKLYAMDEKKFNDLLIRK